MKRKLSLCIITLVCIGLTITSVTGFIAPKGIIYRSSPDLLKCTVSGEPGKPHDGFINTCPVVHIPGDDAASERFCDVVVTLYDGFNNPIEGYPASNFFFDVDPHPSYPDYGEGVNESSPYHCCNCTQRYMVYCLDAETNMYGEMRVRVDLGIGCAPSMVCPVYVWVDVAEGRITDPGEILQNSFDIVANGIVLGPDFGAFATAYVGWTAHGELHPEADFVYSDGQSAWGEVYGPDFGAFAGHYGHECSPWEDYCDC